MCPLPSGFAHSGYAPSGYGFPYSGHSNRSDPNLIPGSMVAGSTFSTPNKIYPGSEGGFASRGQSGSMFSYEELHAATGGFQQANKLGEGGFGKVYKGVLRDGREVAVKVLTVGGGQGEREFQAEVETISRVHHRYLVTLFGYCIANEQRLLVYEFVANGTLDSALHCKHTNGQSLISHSYWATSPCTQHCTRESASRSASGGVISHLAKWHYPKFWELVIC